MHKITAPGTGIHRRRRTQRPVLFHVEMLLRRLHISTRHLINLRKAGLPYIQLGAVVRYDMGEVLAYLKTNRRLSSHVERQKRRAQIGVS